MIITLFWFLPLLTIFIASEYFKGTRESKVTESLKLLWIAWAFATLFVDMFIPKSKLKMPQDVLNVSKCYWTNVTSLFLLFLNFCFNGALLCFTKYNTSSYLFQWSVLQMQVGLWIFHQIVSTNADNKKFFITAIMWALSTVQIIMIHSTFHVEVTWNVYFICYQRLSSYLSLF